MPKLILPVESHHTTWLELPLKSVLVKSFENISWDLKRKTISRVQSPQSLLKIVSRFFQAVSALNKLGITFPHKSSMAIRPLKCDLLQGVYTTNSSLLKFKFKWRKKLRYQCETGGFIRSMGQSPSKIIRWRYSIQTIILRFIFQQI